MIPLYSSYIKRKDMDSVLNCLVSDSVGPGEYSDKLLKSAKELFGFDAGIALRSPYFALTEILKRLGLPDKSKIAVSPLAPYYQKQAIEDTGYIPEYIDHNIEDCSMNVSEILETSSAALILYEPFGMLPDPEQLKDLAIPVIEDISQSFGAFRKETKAGTVGDFCVFGMEETSIITAGGGALLFTSKKKNTPIIRAIFENCVEEKRLTDFNAALGYAKLKEALSAFQKRSELEKSFQMVLARTRHTTYKYTDEGESGKIAFPILLETGMKDAIIHAKKNGVETAPAFEKSIIALESFPVTTCPSAHTLHIRTLLFPLHQKISQKDAQTIAKVIATMP